MSKLRFGVLSTAKIGTDKVIPAMQAGQFTEVVAIASRDLERAQTAATQLDIPRAYGSYGELLADPEVDAIYNPLPNHLHVPWTIKALDAGKHVLCEKPIGLSVEEAQKLVTAAQDRAPLKVMEAFMYRHHPQWKRAQEIVAAGGIGQLITVHSFFSYFNDDPQNIRNQADIGGGGLMDIGCYCISLARLMFAAEPIRVCGLIDYDSQLNIDCLASGILEFPTGTATFTCSTQLTPYQRVNIFGTLGRIEIEIPFNAPSDQPCKMWHERDEQIEEIMLATCDQYTQQGDLFARAVYDDTPVPTPLNDALANMRVIDSLLESGKQGGWITACE
jgi:predicted dehydrogenase